MMNSPSTEILSLPGLCALYIAIVQFLLLRSKLGKNEMVSTSKNDSEEREGEREYDGFLFC